MNEQTRKRVALVTGASSGIGRETALHLAAAGFDTYAAARRIERMADLVEHGIQVLPLDVTDDASIVACLAAIHQTSGRGVDVLVNNAGYGSYGALEEVPPEEARRQFDVNLFGLARLTQLVVPHMRERRWGRIINVSSIGGVMATPYGGWYHATKFALEGYSTALRQELLPFGIDVAVIRPAGTQSEWGRIATESLQRVSGSGPYGTAVCALMEAFKKGADSPRMVAPASSIAGLIRRAASDARPRTVYAPGLARVFLFARWLLSDRAHDALLRLMFRLPKVMGKPGMASSGR